MLIPCHQSKELQKRSDGASLLQMLRSPEAPAELKRAHLKEAVIALKQLVQARQLGVSGLPGATRGLGWIWESVFQLDWQVGT